jgi:hypothetical protein
VTVYQKLGTILMLSLKGVFPFLIQIGKSLKLSLPFPPVHTVRATFTAYGVPTNPISITISLGVLTIDLPEIYSLDIQKVI